MSDALDKLNCTRIVIAHRLSIIRNFDLILAMDKGSIIEEGVPAASGYSLIKKENHTIRLSHTLKRLMKVSAILLGLLSGNM